MTRLLYCFICFLLISCSAKRTGVSSHNPLGEQLNSEINRQHHTGFILKDLQNGNILFEQDADKNFIASSNIKLFTLYAGLNILKDSVPCFQYLVKGDSLLVWPMADPTFLHPDFNKHPAFDFLKNSGKDIYLVNGRYKGQKYGKGWAWDEYNSSDQTEITDFPIYGNVISYSVGADGKAKLFPDLSALYFGEITKNSSSKSIRRSFSGNNLSVPEHLSSGYSQKIPIVFNKNLKESLLTDTLLAAGYATTSVTGIPWKPVPAEAKIFYNAKTENVYKMLVKNNDNFFAEHLLLNCAVANKKEMTSKAGITEAQKYLGNLKEGSFFWADACGLSPQNLASPRTLLSVLEQIRIKVNNDELLFSIFAQGGKDGTLKSMFKNTPDSFVFAQTGNTANTYNISGYLIGKSGKKYAFSYLNNNFLKSENVIKSEVERFLTYIHSNY